MMRFIVDLYRYIIIAACGVAVIAAALAIMLALSSGTGGLPIYVILAVVAALLFLVLNLGVLAILISVHDRHIEIAENTEDIATALDQIADRIGEFTYRLPPTATPSGTPAAAGETL